MKNSTYDAVALFSGGLDSIIAARLIQDQGLTVKCLHFVTPFFDNSNRIPFWKKTYGLNVTTVDIGNDFVAMMKKGPEYGFGSVLNPCVDCKILMMRKAKEIMEQCGAKMIVSGEVLGQRPMSQRKDTLNVIRRDADVKECLIRPLCAKLLEETPMEASGLVDRSRLAAISGRGRKKQLEFAAQLGITNFPSPAGGCRLTEVENGRSYWPVLHYSPAPDANDFVLANTGRQFWSFTATPPYRLIIGRNQADNTRLVELARPGDILFKTASFPGPVSLARPFPDQKWSEATLADAATFCASYSPKAVTFSTDSGKPVDVKMHTGPDFAAVLRHVEDGAVPSVPVSPNRETPLAWRENAWEEAKEEIRAMARQKNGESHTA
ncbi:MAG: tRNA sulfurtransferase [Desulfovibrio sp.]